MGHVVEAAGWDGEWAVQSEGPCNTRLTLRTETHPAPKNYFPSIHFWQSDRSDGHRGLQWAVSAGYHLVPFRPKMHIRKWDCQGLKGARCGPCACVCVCIHTHLGKCQGNTKAEHRHYESWRFTCQFVELVPFQQDQKGQAGSIRLVSKGLWTLRLLTELLIFMAFNTRLVLNKSASRPVGELK